jgi:hypothetical protein
MEKKWLFVIGIVIVMILAAISFLSITETTGSFVYGKCWSATNLADNDKFKLRTQGCIIEEQRVCCPTESCPTVAGVNC